MFELDHHRAVRIARVELRRSWRNVRPDTTYGLLAIAGAGLLYLGYGVGGGVLGYLFGSALGGGLPGFVRPVVGSSGTALFAFTALMALQRTAKQVGSIDHAGAVLTRAPVSAVVGGLIAAESARYLGFLALPVLGMAIGLGVGAGSVALPAAVVAVVVAVVAGAVALGYALGLGVRLLVARSETLARYKTLVGITTTLVMLGAYGVLTARPPTDVFLALARRTPLGWLGRPVVLAAPGLRASAGIAAAGLAVPLVVAVGSIPAATWLARRRWFRAAVQPDADAVGTDGSMSGLSSALRRLPAVPETGVAVALAHLRRARRAPFTVQYAVIPFFMLIYQVQYVVRTGTVGETLPVVLGLIVPWSAGAAFSLNPLGDQGPVLGHVLLGESPTREVVVGTALAGWVLGAPALLAVVPAAGVLAGWPAAELALVAAVSLGLLAAAPAMAAGFGVAYPKFEPRSLGGDREATVPSPWAFLGFTLVYGLLALPAYLGSHPLVSGVLGDLTGLSPGAFLVGGAVVTLGLAAVCGAGGGWYAVRRIDRYRR